MLHAELLTYVFGVTIIFGGGGGVESKILFVMIVLCAHFS